MKWHVMKLMESQETKRKDVGNSGPAKLFLPGFPASNEDRERRRTEIDAEIKQLYWWPYEK